MGIKLVKKTKDNEEIYLSDIEEIIKKNPIVKFSKDIIIIPNVCAITPENKDGFLKRLLNSSEDFVSVSNDKFNNMLDVIDLISQETHILIKESKTIPKYNILINLEVLKDNAFFIKSSRNILEVNGIIFTDSELDYQGFGLFTSKEPIFLTFDEMAHIKDILTVFSDELSSTQLNTKKEEKKEN